MDRPTIVWDFDGTILPSDPDDSEQTLLNHVLRQPEGRVPFGKRVMGHFALFSDRQKLFPGLFKRVYIHLLTDLPVSVLDFISEKLAQRISPEDRLTFSKLKNRGFPMIVMSCGTVDLSTRVLRVCGIEDCFQRIEGNRFRIEAGRIAGIESRIPDPESKVRVLMSSYGLKPSQVVAVGDGYTDIPLLDWAGVSVLIDRTGKKAVQERKYPTITSPKEIFDILNLSDPEA